MKRIRVYRNYVKDWVVYYNFPCASGFFWVFPTWQGAVEFTDIIINGRVNGKQ